MNQLHNLKIFTERRRKLRKEATSQEKILWEKLRNKKTGLKWRRQHSIGGYIADFYCAEKKLIIEIDGAHHFQNENKEYDKNRTDYFDGLDVKVIRFTNEEIDKNLEEIIVRISSPLLLEERG